MTTEHQRLIQAIKGRFSHFSEIQSAYAYGSIIGNRASKKSDLDILFIVKDTESPQKLLRRIKLQRDKFQGISLDVNVVFRSEFNKRWHIYRPASFYLGIKYQSILLWGKDLLAGVKESEFTKKDMYKRMVDLAQSSRGIYMNGKDNSVWEKKYVRWLRVAALEILFLEGAFELNYRIGIRQLIRKHPALRSLSALYEDQLDMGQNNKIAETLRMFLEPRRK